MTFRVGQKVVCVNPCNDLVRGRVYTILKTGVCFHDGKNRSIVLVDQTRFGAPSGRLPFFAERFRPVVERKTDISIFTQMLKPSKVRA